MTNSTGQSGFSKVPSEDPKDERVSELDYVEEEVDEDTVCGLGKFRSAWMQRFANTKCFFAMFCILGVLEGAAFTYMIGVLSTWEKRYAFDSKISGLIMIADNLSAIFISILVGYYGSQAHRPRWIAIGMFIVSFSCLLSSTPYFIYGPGLHLLTRNVELNKTVYQLCQTDPPDEICERDNSMTITAITIFFIANLLNGFGYTAFYTVGTAYMDDSVKKKNSSIYFATQMSFRLLGPSFGYILASFSLQFYENPFYDPGLTTNDPRWVGAWWVGFVILGVLLFIFSIPMLFFPKRLPSQPVVQTKEESGPTETRLKFKDIPRAFFRLIQNPVWFFHTVAIVFHVNGYMGYFILMPRYMEAHFRQTASGASFFSGSTSILTMILGIMVGGVVINKFRPRPRLLTGYMAAISLCAALAMFASMFLACPSVNLLGEPTELGPLELDNNCNDMCGCTTKVFHPVCSSSGQSTYFSPCYAGCTEKWDSPGNETILKNCRCDIDKSSSESVVDLISGYCPFDCNLFLPYIVVMSLSKMIGSTARVGSMLVSLRCVDPKDKNLSLGGFSAVLGAFAFIPYPLVFGAVADSTCLVWEEKCGKTGNCWVYDIDKLRYRMHGASFALLLIGTLLDCAVCYFSDRMTGNFYQDDPETLSGEKYHVPLKDLDDSSEKEQNFKKTGVFSTSKESLSGL